MPRHRPRNTIEIRRPPAPALELVGRVVEGRVAGGAGVGAGAGHVFVVGAGVGRFGAFLAEDAELFCEGCLVDGVGDREGRRSTRVENGLPFVVALGDGVRHVSRGSGAEEGA